MHENPLKKTLETVVWTGAAWATYNGATTSPSIVVGGILASLTVFFVIGVGLTIAELFDLDTGAGAGDSDE